MNKYSNIFERILYIIEKKGLKNVAGLADIMGYGSPQKIYRLKQEENSKPSYDMISDFSNKFEDLNLRWFITGKGDPFLTNQTTGYNLVNEPPVSYNLADQVLKLEARISELEIEKKSLLLALREIGAGRPPEKGQGNPSDKKKPK